MHEVETSQRNWDTVSAVSTVSNHPPLGENGQLQMNVPLHAHLHKTKNIKYLRSDIKSWGKISIFSKLKIVF